jgi:hypothetical protein
MTDLDFNFIKIVGPKGSEMLQFDGPYDICLSSSKFYICDFEKKRIQVYSKDFDFVTSFKVEYYSWIVFSKCVLTNDLSEHI